MKDHNTKISFGESIKNDLPSGIVVFLVALPLCLGISLASGAPPITGVIAGIVGGVVVGFMSNSALGVSGPAAGLAGIVAGYLMEVPFEFFLLAVVLSGMIQVALGYIKAGVIADYFPSNVIKGMLAAIGIILIMKQIPHGLGYDKDAEGEMDFIQTDGSNTFTEVINAIMNPSLGAVIITVICMGILILWQTQYFKKNKILKLTPGPLIVVLVGVGLNAIFQNWLPQYALSNDHLVNIPIFDGISDFSHNLKHPSFGKLKTLTGHEWNSLFTMGLTIAIVASLETLLSVEATDKLDPLKRITTPDKELIAQGTGNIVSGLIGGLPITQVIVRSSANVESGGKTNTSTIFHGILLLVSILAFPTILNLIPKSCLAAILLLTGYKLANLTLFKQMLSLKPRQYAPFIITIIAILFSDLLVGILIGLIVSIFFILQNNRHKEPFDVKIKKINENGKKYLAEFYLNEEVTYLSKNILMLSFHDIPSNSIIKVDLSGCLFISHDVLEAIDDFKKSVAPRKNIEFHITKRQLGSGTIDTNIIAGLGKASNLA